MKRLLAFFTGIMLSTVALATDNPIGCQGNSCSIVLYSRTSGGTATQGLKVDGTQITTLVGLKLPTSGGTPTTLDFYEEASGSITFDTNVTSNTAVAYKAVRLGKIVMLTLAQTSIPVTGSQVLISASSASSHGLPQRFCPSANQTAGFISVNASGANQATPGLLTIANSISNLQCDVQLRKDATNGSFTTSISISNSGSGFTGITYSVQ